MSFCAIRQFAKQPVSRWPCARKSRNLAPASKYACSIMLGNKPPVAEFASPMSRPSEFRSKPRTFPEDSSFTKLSRPSVTAHGVCLLLLDVADLEGLFERLDRVVGGREFVGEIAVEARRDDCAGDGGVVELLRVVDFVAAGDAGCVEVGQVFLIFLNGSDDVAFHDLHVVDVV